MSMSLRLLAVSAAFAFAGATFAATPATTAPAPKSHTAQQQRMVNCNKQATGKKGAERRAFMSTCLKGGSAAAAAAPAAASAAEPSAKQAQQGKMKTCNAEAKSKALKGAERKTFMSSCLKGDAAAAS
jgi:psiF repeat-containing protein